MIAAGEHSPERTSERVRRLSVSDLHLGQPPEPDTAAEHGSNEPDDPTLDAGDSMLETVKDLLDHFGGVIFVGPPGTSKSWYAAKVAHALAEGDTDRVRYIQFHPSYQYEDFVQGLVPRNEGGFRLVPKHLVQMCENAEATPDKLHVLVIDELSRGDPGRIFGEALTYVEKTKRNLAFSLASGDTCRIPANLIFLATMNPLDRGVDEVDTAFERRFGKIAMDPDPAKLEAQLQGNGVTEPLLSRIVGFFRWVNARARDNPFASIGHTFFFQVRDEADLRRLWDHQLRFVFEKAYRLDPDGHREVREQWNRITQYSQGAAEATPAANGDPLGPGAGDQGSGVVQ